MYQIAAETAEPPSDQPTSTILAQLLTNLRGDRVTVGAIMDAAGSRAYVYLLAIIRARARNHRRFRIGLTATEAGLAITLPAISI
jgi:hypothetical protein